MHSVLVNRTFRPPTSLAKKQRCGVTQMQTVSHPRSRRQTTKGDAAEHVVKEWAQPEGVAMETQMPAKMEER